MTFDEAYRGRRVMVTGGLGFVGSNLAHRLVALGADVLLVDSLIPEYGGNLHNIADIRDDVSVNVADVRDEHSMRYLVQGQDYIFNLAGQVSHTDSMTDPYTDLEINCRSQLTLLEACRKNNQTVKVVYSSTTQIYGAAERLPVSEQQLRRPMDVNGINKMAGEWYHILYNNVYGVRACSLRLTRTYGPRMLVKHARQTALGWFVRQVLDGEEVQIFEGTQLRDYTYIDDVTDALLLAGVSDAVNGDIFNLGGIQPVSLLELVRTLVEVAGTGSYRVVPFPADRKRIDIGDFYADYSKIELALGWRPTIGLREGLAQTVAYYQANRRHYWPGVQE